MCSATAAAASADSSKTRCPAPAIVRTWAFGMRSAQTGGLLDRDDAVGVAPEQQRRRRDAVQPLLQLEVVGALPEHARERGRLAVAIGQELGRRRHRHARKGREVGDQVLEDLLVRDAEDVHGRMLRDAQTPRRDEHEPPHAARIEDREVRGQRAAHRVAGERDLVEAELVEQIEVVQVVVVQAVDARDRRPTAPKPGWMGTISRAFSASGSRVSKPVIVPPPWRKTTGAPSPAVRTAVSMPLMSCRSSLKAAISRHPPRPARPWAARSRARGGP